MSNISIIKAISFFYMHPNKQLSTAKALEGRQQARKSIKDWIKAVGKQDYKTACWY